MTGRIIVALDGMTAGQASDHAGLLVGKPGLWGFKGNDLLLDLGASQAVAFLGRGGRANVLLDPKLHDTSTTVANSVKKLADAGAALITVHAAGGFAMIKAAVDAADGTAAKILAVTVLTSMTQQDLTAEASGLGHRPCLEDLVSRRAIMAADAGVWGIVCAPGDLKHVSYLRDRIKFVTPNIRLDKNGPGDDQNRDRQMTPEEAIEAGADFLVVGRPITKAEDPVAALAIFNDRVESAISRMST